MSADIDDVFDEDGDERRIDEVSWRKVVDACMKDGFRDGITEGQEKSLQHGFDMGYAKGYQQSFPIAMIRGVMGAMRSYLFQTNLMDSQEIVHIAKELVGLEKDILEFNKVSVVKKDNSDVDMQDDELLSMDSDNGCAEMAQLTLHDNDEVPATSYQNQQNRSSENEEMTKQMILQSGIKEKVSSDLNIHDLCQQFESIKKRSVHIMNELGLSELCSLICDITWKDVEIHFQEYGADFYGRMKYPVHPTAIVEC